MSLLNSKENLLLKEETNPDWVLSQNMGHSLQNAQKSHKDVERKERPDKRQVKLPEEPQSTLDFDEEEDRQESDRPMEDTNVHLKVLFNGYSKFENGNYYANCSCVLITGSTNVIIDTLTVWDEEKLLTALKTENINCDEIQYVICTHGHSDHTGCNHLFKKAIHIVGFSISHKDKYFLEPNFQQGEEYVINNRIKVIPTPGHTLQDVSVIVETNKGTIAVTGDLFEKYEDLFDESVWKSAGSDSEVLQTQNRQRIFKMTDFIVPGHGPMFEITEELRKKFTEKV